MRAILGRTERDDTSVAGASGSALCLGNESAEKCQSILLQNYQSLIGKKIGLRKSTTFNTFSLDCLAWQISRAACFFQKMSERPKSYSKTTSQQGGALQTLK